jgi:hypothetical protein
MSWCLYRSVSNEGKKVFITSTPGPHCCGSQPDGLDLVGQVALVALVAHAALVALVSLVALVAVVAVAAEVVAVVGLQREKLKKEISLREAVKIVRVP